MTHKAGLIILDGWGIGDGTKADAIANAHTPNYDAYLEKYAHSRLKTFGENVGLPVGQMGNSEVGHLNIGAGRIVYQDLVRINREAESGGLAENSVLQDAIHQARTSGGALHFMGLVSHGGVHSSQKHLHALVDIAEQSDLDSIYIHAFTDGRDTDPMNAVDCIGELSAFLDGKKTKLVSMIGRYYAMDRDKRWERIKSAYELLVLGSGEPTEDFTERCRAQYDEGMTDEFFTASVITSGEGRIRANDVVICFNFRTDRCRQITTVLTQKDMPEWGMTTLPLHYVTMTRYDEAFRGVHVMYEKENLKNTLGEVVSAAGKKQLRIAETEKYPHVTFFFSGGREEPFGREIRIMADSPKVATYDLQPEMSAQEVADKAITCIEIESPDFVCLNFANPDMVGHTGVYSAIVQAVETIDQLMHKVVEAMREKGYHVIIIADHGNADKAIQADGKPHTAHTTNLVPCILASNRAHQLKDGILADVAPTLLELMNLEAPAEMTGSSLLVE